MTKSRTRIYGLTGGIASGKSTVGSFFRDYGIPLIDADQIARSIRAPGGAAESAIMARFGTNEPAKLRDLISRDATARKDLEALLHPLIRAESERQFDVWRARRAPYLIYEATFLIEAGRSEDFDGVILVDAEDATRLNRLITRDSMKEPDARRFLDAQAAAFTTESVRKKAITHRILNDGEISHLREATRLLHLEFLARFLRER